MERILKCFGLKMILFVKNNYCSANKCKKLIRFYYNDLNWIDCDSPASFSQDFLSSPYSFPYANITNKTSNT